jgi:hypothetical protein
VQHVANPACVLIWLYVDVLVCPATLVAPTHLERQLELVVAEAPVYATNRCMEVQSFAIHLAMQRGQDHQALAMTFGSVFVNGAVEVLAEVLPQHPCVLSVNGSASDGLLDGESARVGEMVAVLRHPLVCLVAQTNVVVSGSHAGIYANQIPAQNYLITSRPLNQVDRDALMKLVLLLSF